MSAPASYATICVESPTPQSRKKRAKSCWIRQRMASVPAGLRSRQVILDACEERARQMRLVVELPPERKVCQRMAAVDDDELRIAEPLVELLRAR